MNLRRIMYAKRFELGKSRWRHLDAKYLDQLDACKDDAARRLLLGGDSKKMPIGQMVDEVKG